MEAAVATQKSLSWPVCDEVAGEGHDDLGRERNAGRLDTHEQGDACVTARGDYSDDEGGEGGDDFLRHSGAV